MIRSFHRSEAPAPLLRRFVAVVSMALVLLLGASTMVPALHHWWHADHSHASEDHCAVVLFASGITLAAGALALARRAITWRSLITGAVVELFLMAPRYLRQPERGPPAA